MTIIQAVFLAVIQGLTEFLPISSSAHLILPSQLLGWTDQGLAFDVAVHVGTLVAVVFYFRHDVVTLFGAWLQSLRGNHSIDSRIAWFVIFATLPAVLIGWLSDSFIEAYLRSGLVIAATTIGFGLLLWLADVTGGRRRELYDLSIKHALVIGFAQALALIPGTSRSGITMTAALLLGYTRQTAARFSFFLSMPLIAAAGSYETYKLLQEPSFDWSFMLIGAVASFVSAYVCIKLFMSWLDRIGMLPFVVYRLILGTVLLVILL